MAHKHYIASIEERKPRTGVNLITPVWVEGAKPLKRRVSRGVGILANFYMGLHVILQIQIFKNQKCLISYVKKYFNRKSVEVQPWTPLGVIYMSFVYEIPYAVCNGRVKVGRVSGCCHIEFGATYLLWRHPHTRQWNDEHDETIIFIKSLLRLTKINLNKQKINK